MNSSMLYVKQLWQQSVRTNNGDYAFLREIEHEITPKAFEAIKNQASLFPRYRVSPYNATKGGYYVMYKSADDKKRQVYWQIILRLIKSHTLQKKKERN